MTDIRVLDRAICYPFLPAAQFMTTASDTLPAARTSVGIEIPVNNVTIGGVTYKAGMLMPSGIVIPSGTVIRYSAPPVPDFIRNIREVRIEYKISPYKPSASTEDGIALIMILSSLSDTEATFKVFMPNYGISNASLSVPVTVGEPAYGMASYVRLYEPQTGSVTLTTPSSVGALLKYPIYVLHNDCIFLYQAAPSIKSVTAAYGMTSPGGLVLKSATQSVSAAVSELNVKAGNNVTVDVSSAGFRLVAAGRKAYSISAYPFYVSTSISSKYERKVPLLSYTEGLLSINGQAGAVYIKASPSVYLNCGSTNGVITVTCGKG